VSKLSKALSVYVSSTSIEHRVTTIKWAKRVLDAHDMEWFVCTIMTHKDFDLVLHEYKQAYYRGF
jgi:hypothetical protein